MDVGPSGARASGYNYVRAAPPAAALACADRTADRLDVRPSASRLDPLLRARVTHARADSWRISDRAVSASPPDPATYCAHRAGAQEPGT
jgi:hypothetical protein